MIKKLFQHLGLLLIIQHDTTALFRILKNWKIAKNSCLSFVRLITTKITGNEFSKPKTG